MIPLTVILRSSFGHPILILYPSYIQSFDAPQPPIYGMVPLTVILLLSSYSGLTILYPSFDAPPPDSISPTPQIWGVLPPRL